MIEQMVDPDYETKYAKEAEEHAKKSAAWIQKGMKEDAAPKSKV